MLDEERKRNKGDAWCWNEEVNVGKSSKKDAHKVLCRNGTEENKDRYKIMKNKARKAVSKAIAERLRLFLLSLSCPNGMFTLVKGLTIDSIEVDGERYMR